MSVLARDLDAYQRAYDQYRRQAEAYNAQVKTYNQTLATDASGQAIVRDAMGYYYAVDETGVPRPITGDVSTYEDRNRYAYTPIPTNDFYSTVRTPDNVTVNQQQGVVQQIGYDNVNGVPIMGYFLDDGQGNLTQYTPPQNAELTVSPDGTTFTATEYTYTLTPKPDEAQKPAEFSMNAPDPTKAQIRKMNAPSLAQQERLGGGLIAAEVFRSGGPLSRGLAKRPDTDVPAPPPAPEQPIEDTFNPDLWPIPDGGGNNTA